MYFHFQRSVLLTLWKRNLIVGYINYIYKRKVIFDRYRIEKPLHFPKILEIHMKSNLCIVKALDILRIYYYVIQSLAEQSFEGLSFG